MMMGKHMGHGIANKIDMDVLEQIISLAEQAMGKSIGKKKPDLTVMEVSMDKKPLENEVEQENEGDTADKAEDLAEYGTENPSPEQEDDMSSDDIESLIEEYKKRKG